MSNGNGIIKRAVEKLVRSEAFMQIFTDHLMVHLEQQLRQESCGDRIYVAKTNSVRHRDAQIKSKFRGNNFEQLAAEFDLSERQVRRICCGKTARK